MESREFSRSLAGVAPKKAFSEACERNKDPILQVLRHELHHAARVLEIGSGTGQHAVYFARHLPHLQWQTSDVADNHPSILGWIAEAAVANVAAPLTLDVNHRPWPVTRVDGVFTAITAHIMAWPSVVNMFHGVGEVLDAGGVFCLYGPLSYSGRYTSDSNAHFDHCLRQRDPDSGIRDFEALDRLAIQQGMTLSNDYDMPANNRLVVWRKAASCSDNE